MPDGSNIVYRYDGSYQGFLCCVAQCCNEKRLPQAVQLLDEPQGTLFAVKVISTQPRLAAQVEASVRDMISPQALNMLREGFLTCIPEKELLLIRFLLLGYQHKARVTQMTLNPVVHALNKALLTLSNEAGHYVEFLRFSQHGSFLAAFLAPKNCVLPLIVHHFTARLNTENFLIYDRTHGMGFAHEGGREEKGRFFLAESLELPEKSESEACYEALWRRFYETVAVEGRVNPKLRRNHMPMRFWPEMTEFQEGGTKRV